MKRTFAKSEVTGSRQFNFSEAVLSYKICKRLSRRMRVVKEMYVASGNSAVVRYKARRL
jgi:hypothetical protein